MVLLLLTPPVMDVQIKGPERPNSFDHLLQVANLIFPALMPTGAG